MPSSRTSSADGSQGSNTTHRHFKPRGSRSVGSPAHSTSSIKLSSVIQMNSFAMSPILSRRSVLTDTTDIDMPRRKSWWRKLDENSREIMEVLNNKDPAEANDAIEEYIDVDVLSQEKKNYTMDLPESSDGESINSIIIPHKKLFTQKESKPQRKFGQIIDNRESLAPLHKTQAEVDKTLNIGRKNFFNQGTKNRQKPLFPSALLNMSVNKTIANKTKELGNSDAKTQVKSLFGNRPGTKRKNMFANFIVSDSEDEIPEIQPRVFEFQKKEQQRQLSLKCRETRLTSPTSSITDIEMDEWRLLPSSTMVDHQLEEGLRATPSKRARLTKLSEGMESINTESNITTNKTKQSNKSIHSKRKSKNLSQFKEMEVIELFDPIANVLELDVVEENTKSGTKNESQCLREHKSKNVSAMYEVNDKNTVTIRNNGNKSLSSIDQVFQNVDGEDFSLVYENEDHNDGHSPINKGEPKDPKEASKVLQFSVSKNVSVTKELQSKSRSRNTTYEPNDKDDNDVIKQQRDKSYNNGQNNFQSTSTNELRDISESESNDLLLVGRIENDRNKNGKYDKVDNYEKIVLQVENNQDSIDKHEINRDPYIYNRELSNNDDDREDDNMSDQIKQHVKYDQEIPQKEQSSNTKNNDEKQHSNDNDQNFSQEEEHYSEEKIITEEIQDHYEEENKACENIDNQINEGGETNIHNVEIEYSDMDEIIDNVEIDDNQQDKDITRNKKRHREVKQNLPGHDKIDNGIIRNKSKRISRNQNNFEVDDGSNETTKDKRSNLTVNNSTSRDREKRDAKIPSPEIILHEKPSQMESFTVQGRNTTVRKTKSVIKNLTIRPSLAPVRGSIDLSSESRNSSMEGSGWDSHRTTRRTLRQTFGKDFTPRKSLRTLVMEKSAKRHTNFSEINAEFSRFPQANSTELPGSVSLGMDQSDVIGEMNRSNDDVPHNKSNDAHNEVGGSGNAHKLNKSDQEALVDINLSKNSKEDRNLSHSSENAQQINEIGDSDQEISDDINYCREKQKNNESDREMNDFDVKHDTRVDQVVLRESDYSDEEQKYYESDRQQENNESNHAQENNVSDDGYEMDESNRTTTREIKDSDEAPNIDKSDHGRKIVESDNAHNVDKSEQELMPDIDNSDNSEDDDDSQETNESDQEVLAEFDEVDPISTTNNMHEMEESTIAQEISESIEAQETNKSQNSQDMDKSEDAREEEESDDAREENESDDSQEENESDDAREEIESDDAQEENESDDAREENESDDAREEIESHDAQEENESDNAREENESDDAREEIESHDVQEENESDDVREGNESDDAREEIESHDAREENEIDHAMSFTQYHNEAQKNKYNHEDSRKTRQTTLEIYLQKAKNKNLERKKQLEDEIRNSLKAPGKSLLNPFKVPAVPKLRRVRTQPMKPKAKLMKSSVIPLNMLPDEVLEDMKYKPPKRYRPTNASWITKRLYKYLETKLETKYDYKARIRSEKLVETIYNFTKDIRRHSTAPPDTIDALKREMARLNVVKTHFEFYEFFHEYMPREVRVKVVPDLFNKISLPKYGVFSDILR